MPSPIAFGFAIGIPTFLFLAGIALVILAMSLYNRKPQRTRRNLSYSKPGMSRADRRGNSIPTMGNAPKSKGVMHNQKSRKR